MTIKTLSKNSMGVVLALLLVLFLSESRLFNFFTDTYLGRAFLILVILIASYLNKILGVVCVFIIIIMFNNNGSYYYEGFDGNSNDNTGTTSTASSPTDVSSSSAIEKVKNIKNAVAQNSTMTPTTTTTTTTGTTITNPINTPTPVPNDKINVIASAAQSNNSGNNIEGFDLQSTENNIKRGKQSNSIPVNAFLMQSPNVAPYESANFSENFGVL